MKVEIRESLLSFGAHLLPSSLLSITVKIKIYRTIILPVVLVLNLVAHIERGT